MAKFSKEKEEIIINLYKQGKTQKEIGVLFNTFNTSIRRVLLRNNIIPRGNNKVQRLCKHNPFKKNDEYSEYFLGLLLTDGCISNNITKTSKSINLSLTEKDGYIVETFKNWISPKSKVSKIHQNINNSYMYSFSFTNKEVEEWLIRKGNFKNKSFECKIYTPITWHILRGIFDGDGGFHPNCKHLDFFICGKSINFLKQVKMFLEKHGFHPHLKERCNGQKNNLFYLEIYKIEEVLKLGEFMYNNAHIFIKRKYEKWLTFYESKRIKHLKFRERDGNSTLSKTYSPNGNNKESRDVQRL